jgi:hypothetical protein
MSQSDSENDLLHAAAAAAERDAGMLTAAAARKRARTDAGGDGGSTGERVRSPERAAARSRKRRAVLDARTATTAEARRDAVAATEAAVTARTEQRAAAKADRRDANKGFGHVRAGPRASAAPAFVRVVRKARAAARRHTALAVQQKVGAAFAAGASGAAHPPRGGSRGRRARAKAAAGVRRAKFEGGARASAS